jgi:hypothetical protein
MKQARIFVERRTHIGDTYTEDCWWDDWRVKVATETCKDHRPMRIAGEKIVELRILGEKCEDHRSRKR